MTRRSITSYIFLFERKRNFFHWSTSEIYEKKRRNSGDKQLQNLLKFFHLIKKKIGKTNKLQHYTRTFFILELFLVLSLFYTHFFTSFNLKINLFFVFVFLNMKEINTHKISNENRLTNVRCLALNYNIGI